MVNKVFEHYCQEQQDCADNLREVNAGLLEVLGHILQKAEACIEINKIKVLAGKKYKRADLIGATIINIRNEVQATITKATEM